MGYRVAIVGATGAVGRELLRVLEERKFPVDNLLLFGTRRSAGTELSFNGDDIKVKVLGKRSFSKSDITFFCAGAAVSVKFARHAVDTGSIVIDNSSAFRYQDDVPLVIPEINPEDMEYHQGIIANPNCTGAIAAVVLWPIYEQFGLEKVIISTYQAVSGAGSRAIQELENHSRSRLVGMTLEPKEFAHPMPFNLIPHIDSFEDNDYTREEMKVVWEIQKMFHDDSIKVSVTAVRVPVFRAHSEAITLETKRKIRPEAVRKLLMRSKGVEVVDEPKANRYPMPLTATQKYNVEVGRIRQSLVFGEKGIDLFVSGDQLLKGAALNAVQIAELL